jgi:hypothetical protein
MSSRAPDRRPLVTAALVTSGSVLALTGLSMLSWPAAPMFAKACSLLGLSGKGVGTAHQVAAVGFLGSAGVHVFDKRRVVARHLKATAARGAAPVPAAEPPV